MVKPLDLLTRLFPYALLSLFSLNAAPITGQANIAGSVSVSATAITFNPSFINTNGALETGSFAGLTGGTIGSLSGAATTGSVFFPGFMVFTTGVASPITFDLMNIAPGVGTLANCSNAAAGSACTPANSPFTLFQLTSNTVVATLQFNGTSYRGSAASGSTPTTSVFSTTSTLQGTIPAIYQTLSSGGSLNGITFAAAIDTTPVVEPSSAVLYGLGFSGLAVFNFRFRQHRALVKRTKTFQGIK